MTIANNSSARRSGFKATNRGIDVAAGIAATKIGTRTLYQGISPDSFYLSGTSVAKASDGIFVGVTLPNANAGNMYTSTRLQTEWVSGTDVKINVYWKSSGVTGNLKLSIQLAAKVDGETTASSDTQTVTTATQSVAGKLNKSQVTFASSLFSAEDWIGILISRDPADASDTLGSDVSVVAIVIEFTGRG